jgi:DNA repair protein RecO (recombination protein O)
MSLPARLHKTEALVLRRAEYGEADYLLSLYTPDYGKLQVVAKGARKATSRLTGQVEPFSLLRVLLKRGKADLHTLGEVEVLEHYLPLREDLERGVMAHHFLELFDQFGAEGEGHPAAFALLARALVWLCDQEADPRLVARYAEFQLLRAMGYEPSLFQCAVSGEELKPEDQFFSLEQGGVVAPAQVAGLNVIWLRLEVFKVLRHFSRSDWATVRALRLDPDHHHDLERVLAAYVSYILERRLKSLRVLEDIRLIQSPSQEDTPL